MSALVVWMDCLSSAGGVGQRLGRLLRRAARNEQGGGEQGGEDGKDSAARLHSCIVEVGVGHCGAAMPGLCRRDRAGMSVMHGQMTWNFGPCRRVPATPPSWWPRWSPRCASCTTAWTSRLRTCRRPARPSWARPAASSWSATATACRCAAAGSSGCPTAPVRSSGCTSCRRPEDPGWPGRCCAALEDAARGLGYRIARLDTGARQPHAQALLRGRGLPARCGNFNNNPVATFFGEKRLARPGLD